MCANSSIIRNLFIKNILNKFNIMYPRKAYTWWYVSEGMEEH